MRNGAKRKPKTLVTLVLTGQSQKHQRLGLIYHLQGAQNSLKAAAVLPKTKVSACDNSIPVTWHNFVESRENCNNHSTIYTYHQTRLFVKMQNGEISFLRCFFHLGRNTLSSQTSSSSFECCFLHEPHSGDPRPNSPQNTLGFSSCLQILSFGITTLTGKQSHYSSTKWCFQEAPSFPQHLGRIGGMLRSWCHDLIDVKQPNTQL